MSTRSLCWVQDHSIKTFRGVEILLQTYLTSALDGGEKSDSRSSRFILRERAPRNYGVRWAPEPLHPEMWTPKWITRRQLERILYRHKMWVCLSPKHSLSFSSTKMSMHFSLIPCYMPIWSDLFDLITAMMCGDEQKFWQKPCNGSVSSSSSLNQISEEKKLILNRNRPDWDEEQEEYILWTVLLNLFSSLSREKGWMDSYFHYCDVNTRIVSSS